VTSADQLEADSPGLTISGDLNNSGTVTVNGTVTVGGAFNQNAGATTLAGGTLTASGGVSIAAGSTLDGSGTISANVTNAGVINVGGSGTTGLLTINGDFLQTVSGSLNMENGGHKVGSDFDSLVTTGQATLEGTLNVTLINGFNPDPGDRFQVITAAGSSGNFATSHLPQGGSVATPFDGTVSF
jgi:hypothetical protein